MTIQKSDEELCLRVAQGLTTWGEHHVGDSGIDIIGDDENDDENDGNGLRGCAIISPARVGKVMEYRYLLESLRQTSTELQFWRRDTVDSSSNHNTDTDTATHEKQTNEQSDSVTSKRIKALEEKVNDLVELIETCPATTKAAHRMLKRFEVWSTREIVNGVLMYKTEERPVPVSNGKKGNEESSLFGEGFSTLLNLPSAQYFARRIDPKTRALPEKSSTPSANDNKTNGQTNDGDGDGDGDTMTNNDNNDINDIDNKMQSMRNLVGVSPSNWNWREYLALSSVPRLLSDERLRKASQSPFTGFPASVLSTIQPQTSDVSKTASTTVEGAPINSSDLASLWVRAHRNSQAFRHMIQLFEVSSVRIRPKRPGQRKSATTQPTEHDRSQNGLQVVGVQGRGNVLVSNAPSRNGPSMANGLGIIGNPGGGGKQLIRRIQATPSEELPASQNDESIDGANRIETKDKTSKGFRATFKGNHKLMTDRIQEGSKIDAIVEWAICNQVLFTDPHIRKAIRLGLIKGETRPHQTQHKQGSLKKGGLT